MGTVNIFDIALMSQVVWSRNISAPHLFILTELRVLCIVWMTLQVEDRCGGETHTGPTVVPHKHVKKKSIKMISQIIASFTFDCKSCYNLKLKDQLFFSLVVYLFSPNLTRPTVIVFWHNTAHFNDFIIPPRCRIVNEHVLFKGWQALRMICVTDATFTNILLS